MAVFLDDGLDRLGAPLALCGVLIALLCRVRKLRLFGYGTWWSSASMCDSVRLRFVVGSARYMVGWSHAN